MTTTITTQLDAEILKVRKRAAEKIARAKREAAAEQLKLDAEVVRLLREQQPDVYRLLAAQAEQIRAAAKEQRAARSKRAAASGTAVPFAPVMPAQHDGQQFSGPSGDTA